MEQREQLKRNNGGISIAPSSKSCHFDTEYGQLLDFFSSCNDRRESDFILSSLPLEVFRPPGSMSHCKKKKKKNHEEEKDQYLVLISNMIFVLLVPSS